MWFIITWCYLAWASVSSVPLCRKDSGITTQRSRIWWRTGSLTSPACSLQMPSHQVGVGGFVINYHMEVLISVCHSFVSACSLIRANNKKIKINSLQKRKGEEFNSVTCVSHSDCNWHFLENREGPCSSREVFCFKVAWCLETPNGIHSCGKGSDFRRGLGARLWSTSMYICMHACKLNVPSFVAVRRYFYRSCQRGQGGDWSKNLNVWEKTRLFWYSFLDSDFLWNNHEHSVFVHYAGWHWVCGTDCF
jgi:hypothetical protein